MERLTYRSHKFNNPVSHGACKDITCYAKCDSCKINDLIAKLCAYEDTGLEPEEIADAVTAAKLMAKSKIVSCFGVDADHIRDLLQAEKDGRLLELPVVAMVEQSLQDGKMKPMGDQKHNGRYAVVYVDHNKWKSPLIDICGKPYNREEAENRMAVLAQKGGEG